MRKRNMAQKKEQGNKKPPEKAKQNGDQQSTRCRVQTLFIWKLSELSEDLNSIKKIQSEWKTTLIEIKYDLQEIYSRVGEAENQISDWKYKEEKILNKNSKRKKNPRT